MTICWERAVPLAFHLCWIYFYAVLIVYEPRHDKTNKIGVRPAKIQISLGIRPVWSESSLCAEWVAKDPSFLHADSEDSDQTGRMRRLIWDFAGRTVASLVLSCRGSYVPFPFGISGRMCNLIVSVPGHCLFGYFLLSLFLTHTLETQHHIIVLLYHLSQHCINSINWGLQNVPKEP